MVILCVTTRSLQSYNPTTLNNNDPLPFFAIGDPHDFLTQSGKNHLENPDMYPCQQRILFTLSPFVQRASCGHDINKNKVALGNLQGNWDVNALLYDAINTTYVNSADGETNENPYIPNELCLATGFPQYDDQGQPTPCFAFLNDPANHDSSGNLGCFEVPLHYEKYGVRAEFQMLLFGGLGVCAQTGYCSLKQTGSLVDLTYTASGTSCASSDCTTDTICTNTITNDCKIALIDHFMKQYDIVTDTLRLNPNNYSHHGFEDLYASLFWRHAFDVNGKNEEWPLFYITPYVSFDVNFPISETVDPRRLLAKPLGDNGHTGIGGTFGCTIDFVETIALSAEIGVMAFDAYTYKNFPVPTNSYQIGLYPYQADVTIKPGTNIHASGTINAYHFLDKLSLYAQYRLVHHESDCFCSIENITPSVMIVSNPDNPEVEESVDVQPIITKESLINRSMFEVHVLNIGSTYDISPSCSLGLGCQIPLKQLNGYASTTVMGSLILAY
jgi:hypothetical protein